MKQKDISEVMRHLAYRSHRISPRSKEMYSRMAKKSNRIQAKKRREKLLAEKEKQA